MMTTVVNLTDEEIVEIKEHTGETDAAAAVRAALEDYLRHRRQTQLQEMSGKLTMPENGSQAKAEIEAKLLEGLDALERGEGSEMTANDWERLRNEYRQRHEIS